MLAAYAGAQNRTRSERKIDLHHHFYATGPLRKFIATYPNPGPILEYRPAKSIEAMDRAEVATSILSCPAPFDEDPATFRDAATAARELNEYGAKMVRDFPGRFGAFAVLPVPQIDESLREIEHALDVLGADGVGIKTSYGNRWLGTRCFSRFSMNCTGGTQLFRRTPSTRPAAGT